jgi:hypothetical protein
MRTPKIPVASPWPGAAARGNETAIFLLQRIVHLV